MAFIPRDQVAAAREMDLLTYLRKFEPQELVHKGGNVYSTRTHDSLKISNGKWCWWSRNIGGKNALDYLTKVEGVPFLDAVQRILGAAPTPATPEQTAPVSKTEFALPPKHADNRRVFSYLHGRGIAPEIINHCIKTGQLYEDGQRHNCVFVGFEGELPRYATLRGTLSEKRFIGEVPGSDKRFCFCLPPKRESKKLAIYEAAIEPLAHLTLEGTTDKWRLSLGGIYAPEEGTQTSRDMKKPIALDAFLARHPEIEEIEICTNNDFAGRWAADHIEKAYQGKYRMVRNLPEKEGCDYADLTKERYEKQAVRQRAACSR